MSDPLVTALAELRRAQQEHAIGAMNVPHKKRFDHGVEVGTYRGLKQAEEILLAAIREPEEQP